MAFKSEEGTLRLRKGDQKGAARRQAVWKKEKAARKKRPGKELRQSVWNDLSPNAARGRDAKAFSDG